LDAEKFNECLSSGRYTENIQLSADGARKLGVYGTPAFVLGTLNSEGSFLKVAKILVGGESDAELKSALDELLKSAAK
jgi:predicted DsbA family dithiol-disulfide isomerase